MDKDDIYFAIGLVLAVLAFFGVDWKRLKGDLPRPNIRDWLFLTLIIGSLAFSSFGWYLSSKRNRAVPINAGTVKTSDRTPLKYVWIPPGDFMMGCSLNDTYCQIPGGRWREENPLHRVAITQGFWIGQTEVTVGAYEIYVASLPAKRHMPQEPPFNQGWKNKNQPIVNIDWNEATNFCQWDDGRLPTEAEWEYAARGKSSVPVYGNLNDIAWNSDTVAHDVTLKTPNYVGLYDTLGNAWEWVNDWYDEDYYGNFKDKTAIDPIGSESGNKRILRGGSYRTGSEFTRLTDRNRDDPSPTEIKHTYGARCVHF